ncbi:MAG: restriction endonuclease [Campylobacterales bacterium]|nr:restriction endonuclease [Campylobacterales bacterium]
MAPTDTQLLNDVWFDFPPNSSSVLTNLFDKKIFDNPKPFGLIYNVMNFGNKDDLVLDFFSGSATTAHAVMQLNAEDGGNRKFIMVQLPETTDEKSEAYKAGYKNICEIGKERIRRAGTKILEENKDKEGIENLDIGFRVFKVDSSNMKDVYYNPNEISQDNLFDMVSNIKEDRTDLDLLFQVLLDSGVELTLPIEEKHIAGKKVYFVDGNVLAACFEDNLTEEFVTELAQCEDLLKVIFKDSSFGSDDNRINVEQIFKQYSPDTQIRVI